MFWRGVPVNNTLCSWEKQPKTQSIGREGQEEERQWRKKGEVGPNIYQAERDGEYTEGTGGKTRK